MTSNYVSMDVVVLARGQWRPFLFVLRNEAKDDKNCHLFI